MACRLAGAKPLSEPMLEYCEFDPWEQTSMKLQSKFIHFHSRKSKIVWKIAAILSRPQCVEQDFYSFITEVQQGSKAQEDMSIFQLTCRCGVTAWKAHSVLPGYICGLVHSKARTRTHCVPFPTYTISEAQAHHCSFPLETIVAWGKNPYHSSQIHIPAFKYPQMGCAIWDISTKLILN